MKIFVLLFAIISVLSAEDFNFAKFEWSGHIKTLVDMANYTEDEVLNITMNIFKDNPMNCQGRIGMPTVDHIPSPTDTCDLDIMDELTESIFKGYSNDYQTFLEKFWSSRVGNNLIKEMEQRGVSKDTLKKALKETWFEESVEADYPFNRLFLEADNVARFSRSGLNNWYTFAKDYQSRTKCNMEIQGKDLPVLVTGKCEGENYRYTSRFIMPSHPFVDLVIYSVCAWSQAGESYAVRVLSCEAAIPGSDKPFGIAATAHMDKGNKPYLQSAYPIED